MTSHQGHPSSRCKTMDHSSHVINQCHVSSSIKIRDVGFGNVLAASLAWGVHLRTDHLWRDCGTPRTSGDQHLKFKD